MTVIFVHRETFLWCLGAFPLFAILAMVAHTQRRPFFRRFLHYFCAALLLLFEGITCEVAPYVFITLTAAIGLSAFFLWKAVPKRGEEVQVAAPVEYLPRVSGQPPSERRVKKPTLASCSVSMCIDCFRTKAPGTMHCVLCRRCVPGHIVHCPITNLCIGHHNFHSYSVFLLSFMCHQLLVVYGGLSSGNFLISCVWGPWTVAQAFATVTAFVASLSALSLVSYLLW